MRPEVRACAAALSFCMALYPCTLPFYRQPFTMSSCCTGGLRFLASPGKEVASFLNPIQESALGQWGVGLAYFPGDLKSTIFHDLISSPQCGRSVEIIGVNMTFARTSKWRIKTPFAISIGKITK